MSVDVSLALDTATVRRSSRGSITAEVHWTFGTIDFPETHWSDFALVIVGWWATALNKTPPSMEVRLQFMEGPFAVILRPSIQRGATADCVRLDGDREGRVVHSANVSRLAIADEIIRVGTWLIRHCESNTWGSSDVETLRTELGALRQKSGFE